MFRLAEWCLGSGPHGDGHGRQVVSGGTAGACVGWTGSEAGLEYNITISAKILKIAGIVILTYFCI